MSSRSHHLSTRVLWILAVKESATKISTSHGELDATWLEPEDARAVFVFSHGAGADHRHASMAAIAEHLANQQISTLRYNFPFMQEGKRRVDSVAVASEVIAEVFAATSRTVPRFLCGHSFGGRMNSHAVISHKIDCQGLVFCSFPLHPSKKPAIKRAEHLPEITLPMLFLSGTRDDLADAALLDDVVSELPSARASLA